MAFVNPRTASHARNQKTAAGQLCCYNGQVKSDSTSLKEAVTWDVDATY